MREFQLSRYIKKWLPLIVLLCFGLTAAVYFALCASQRYVASAVIHYNDESAETGQTPSGSELDVNEIKSSSILSRVLYDLNLQEDYSVDDLISRVAITEVVDEDEESRKEAMLENGEEYVYEPTTYIVSFTADSGEGQDFARHVLDAILDEYFADYSEKYVSTSAITNPLPGLYQDNYDYIEMLEIIDGNISDTITALYQRVNWDAYYRSTATGLSFNDLINEFSFLQSVELSDLFSTVFGHQITKDKDLLLSDYTARIENNDIENLASQEKLDDVMALIDAYVEKMRESGNTDITYEYILDDVYSKDLTDAEGNLIGAGDQTVTYDELIFSWRQHSEDMEYAVIDSAYSQYIMDVFSRCTGNCGTADAEGVTPCASSELTCSALTDPDYAAEESRVEAGIESLVEELNDLYDQVYATNDEYNQYRGAQSISTLSSVSVQKSINVPLYTAIAAAFLLIVCCCGAVLLGRLTDIVAYVFYTDHLTGLSNRSAFDNYLKSRDRRLLDEGSVCVTLDIRNEVEINRLYGRSAGDETLCLFARLLREIFARSGAYLVYNGNAQFFVLAEKTDLATAQNAMERFRMLLDHRTTLTREEIVYEIGIAESATHKAERVRALLSKSMAARVRYLSPAPDAEPAAAPSE